MTYVACDGCRRFYWVDGEATEPEKALRCPFCTETLRSSARDEPYHYQGRLDQYRVPYTPEE